VDVERVVHRVVGVHLVDEPELDLVADAERQSIARCRAGVAVDELQRMFAGVVIRLTSTMSSSHSMPLAAPCAWPRGRARRGRQRALVRECGVPSGLFGRAAHPRCRRLRAVRASVMPHFGHAPAQVP
jgi:hypothetical protein